MISGTAEVAWSRRDNPLGPPSADDVRPLAPFSASSADEPDPEDVEKRTRPAVFPEADLSERRMFARAGEGEVARNNINSAASASTAGFGVVRRTVPLGGGDKAPAPRLSRDEDIGARERDSDSNEEA